MEKENQKQKIYVDNILNKLYQKIAKWHNNEEGLSELEKQRELKFLCAEIVEDVIRDFTGHKNLEIKVNKNQKENN